MLFYEGDHADHMYVISSGKIQLVKQNLEHSVTICYLEQGEFLGEMAIITDSVRSCTAIAAEDSILRVYERDRFEELLHTNSEIAARVIKGLALRLENTTKCWLDAVALLESGK